MKKAILLIHGYVTDKDDFAPLMRYLPALYDHIESPNLPGHGLERADHLKDFNAIDTIKKIDEIAKKLFEEYDCVDVVGFSMGGALTTYLSTMHNFNRIVLLAPANKYINGTVGFTKTKHYFEYLKERIHKEKNCKMKELRENILKDNSLAMNMAFKKLLPCYTPKSLTNFMQIIDYCNYKLDGKKIKTPTLLLWGDIDQLVPRSSARFIKTHFENITIKELKGVSHLMLNSKNNKTLVEMILHFLMKGEVNHA